MSVVYANCNTSVGAPNGSIQQLNIGEVWDADDPLVKARPELFDLSPTRVKSSSGYGFVEQATAAPGEKRKR